MVEEYADTMHCPECLKKKGITIMLNKLGNESSCPNCGSKFSHTMARKLKRIR